MIKLNRVLFTTLSLFVYNTQADDSTNVNNVKTITIKIEANQNISQEELNQAISNIKNSNNIQIIEVNEVDGVAPITICLEN